MFPVLRVFTLLALCAQIAPGKDVALEFRDQLVWTPRFAGIEFAEMRVVQPVKMRGFAVRIHLTEPGIDFIVTPDNGERPGETDGLRTSSFLKNSGCQVAINANQFSPVHLAERRAQEVIGLLVDKGAVVSPAEEGLPALVIDADNSARISQPPFDLSRVRHAVGGFGIVLKDGVVTGSDAVRHPRTAAGISRDGRHLFLLVIDGRQPEYSDGATTEDVARWLLKLGASEGINLDGGGTSTLVARDSAGKAIIVNRPIHLGIPGQERPSASHLGVFAPPLGETKAKGLPVSPNDSIPALEQAH